MDPLVAALLSASEQGHKQRVSALLAQNPEKAECCDEEGSTPLMYAAANGRENVLQLLLQKNVNLDTQNRYGWTALMQAACYGHFTCVFLLIHSGADLCLRNSWGSDALVAAAQGGFATVVKLLLDGVKSGKQSSKVNVEPVVQSLTPLMAAAQCGHTHILSELISHDCNVNATLKTIGWSALMLAAINNQLEAASLLMQNGADLKLVDVSQRTAVQLATAVEHKEMVLLLNGESLEKVSDSEFFEAVKAGKTEKVLSLLKKNNSLAQIQNKDGVTPLMRAANKGHTQICSTLIEAGCPLNSQDSVNGWTALMQATHQRRYAVAKLLIEKGADISMRAKSGSTALVVANMLGDIEMIRIISSPGVDRLRKASVPLVTNISMETNSKSHSPAATTPKKKISLPSSTPHLKTLPSPRPLDTSDVLHEMNLAGEPQHPTASSAFSHVDDGPFPRFPNSRLRTTSSRPSSIGTSFNSSLGTASDSGHSVLSAASPSPAGSFNPSPFDASARSLKSPDPPKQPTFLTPHVQDKQRARFLSRSNPNSIAGAGVGNNRTTNSVLPVTLRGSTGGEGGGVGRVNANYRFSRPSSLIGDGSHSRLLGAPPSINRNGGGGGRGGGGGGGGGKKREELPFMKKFVPPGANKKSSVLLGRQGSSGPLLGGGGGLEDERGRLKKEYQMRRRANTEPFSQPPKNHSPALQIALEGSSLGDYFPLFSEQELDMSSFLTLTDSDLIDLSITSQEDRKRLLALIRKLETETMTAVPEAVGPVGETAGGSATVPMFVFQ